MDIIVFIVLIFLVVILSALVSGSEAALLSLSYTKVKEFTKQEEENKKFTSISHKLLHIKENMKRYITTIVILNNIINIVGSIYVGVLATQLFGEIYLGVVSGVLTFLIILFSEIIPKIYGERYSDKISLIIARPLIFFTFILTPIVYMLEKMTSVFVKEVETTSVSEGEIKEMAMLGMKEGSINKYENEVIENVFRMNDVEVYDIMVPKNKVCVLNKNTKFEEIVEIVTRTGFTRFPVQNSRGDIIGVINTKDLFAFHGREKEFKLEAIMRPVIFAPESMKASTLEYKLKKNRIHMAIVVNEHGDFTGLVTLEDIIEELIGEIEDEFDPESDEKIKKLTSNKYQIDASIDINDLNEELELEIDEDTSYSTLNGYLVAKADGIPKINDTFEVDGGVFRVIKKTKRKVVTVEFMYHPKVSSLEE